MKKYDSELDMKCDNSLSLILRNIKRNSTVLEIGASYGRMTKYLNQHLNCRVDIIEIDKEAAVSASKYAKDYFIGDVEKFEWIEKFKNTVYDYIIFADVLEHLYSPLETIKKSVEHLKDDGSIFLSIPNIAHNAIIIDLIKNQFNYKDTGLLDYGHIRFFTFNTIINLLEEANLSPVRQLATYARVGETEFDNSYDILDNSTALALKNKDYGEVYQFIIEAKKKSFVERNNVTCINNISKKHNYYFSQLFINTEDGFNEKNSIIIPINGNESIIDFYVEKYENIKQFRLDIINTSGIIKIEDIFFVDKDNVIKRVNITGHNAQYEINQLYIFGSSDPQIYFNNSCPNLFKLTIKFTVYSLDIDLSRREAYIQDIFNGKDLQIEDFKKSNLDKEKIIIENDRKIDQLNYSIIKKEERVNQLEHSFIDKEREIDQLKQSIIEKDEANNQLKQSIIEKDKAINQLKLSIVEKEDNISQLNNDNEEKINIINQKNILINEIMNSTSWKITKPLRQAKDVLRKYKK